MTLTFILLLFLPQNDAAKLLDLEKFSIELPKGWGYSPQQGDDSFVGAFHTEHTYLSFDYSEDGYSNSFVETEQEFLQGEYDSAIRNQLLLDNGFELNTYPFERKIVKEFNKDDYPNADYLGIWSYPQKTICFPIKVPADIRRHNVHQKVLDYFYVKFVSPKQHGNGYFGIYFKDLNSNFTFSMSTHNYQSKDLQEMISLFRSIEFENYHIDPEWVEWLDSVSTLISFQD